MDSIVKNSAITVIKYDNWPRIERAYKLFNHSHAIRVKRNIGGWTYTRAGARNFDSITTRFPELITFSTIWLLFGHNFEVIYDLSNKLHEIYESASAILVLCYFLGYAE